jgi:hypothetical protein
MANISYIFRSRKRSTISKQYTKMRAGWDNDIDCHWKCGVMSGVAFCGRYIMHLLFVLTKYI